MSTVRTDLSKADLAGELRARWLWVGMVVAFLTMQAVLCLLIIYLATSDRSLAIVPDYHEQALHWDQRVAARRASEALGWNGTWTVANEADLVGRREIRLALVDRDGRPVAGAVVSAKLFHHARAGEVQELRFTEISPGSGQYAALAEMRKPGHWEIHISAKREGLTFLLDEQRELNWTEPR